MRAGREERPALTPACSRVTEVDITELESRLDKTLPPSYRTFLQASNGCRQPRMLVWRVLPAQEVDWLRVRNQQTVDIIKPCEDFRYA